MNLRRRRIRQRRLERRYCEILISASFWRSIFSLYRGRACESDLFHRFVLRFRNSNSWLVRR